MDRVYREGIFVKINHCRERKAGSTTYYVVKIVKILPNGFMNVEYDSRPGEFQKIHKKNDILKKQTRVCTRTYVTRSLNQKKQQVHNVCPQNSRSIRR
jgi:hypothetical protein